MLIKLVKYELKSTARIFVLVYAALMIIAAINSLLIPWQATNNSTISGGSMTGIADTIYSLVMGSAIFIYCIVAFGTMMLTTVISVIRFYRLLGNEGYLWLSLPASTDAHILAKLLCSTLWFIASSLVFALSLIILFLPSGLFQYLPSLISGIQLLIESGLNVFLTVFLFTLTYLVSWLYSMLMFYAAITIGPNMVKSRFGGSALAYVIIYIIFQILTTVVLVFQVLLGNAIIDVGTTLETVNTVMLIFLGGNCLLGFVSAVVLYILTRFFMTKKLNLA